MVFKREFILYYVNGNNQYFRIAIIIILIIPFGILGVNRGSTYKKKDDKSLRSSYYDYSINYLKTDKDVYYINETIMINASWDLIQEDPKLGDNITYMQLRIFEGDLIWSSEQIHQLGDNIQYNCSLTLQTILNLTGDATEITVSLYHYKEEDFGESISEAYLNNKSVEVLRVCRVNNIKLDLSQNFLFPEDDIFINLSWDLFYNSAYESSYIQLQIFRSEQQLVWNSSKIFEKGANCTRNFNISISDLEQKPLDHEEVLLITCYYYYKSLIRPISNSCYFANQTIIIKVYDYSETLQYQRNGIILLTLGSAFSSLSLFSVIIILFLVFKKKKKYVKDIIIEY
mgnify:CR=1 FL=1